MSLPRYPEYKDSGVAWLGCVPAHWEVSTLRRIIRAIESGVSVNATDTPADSGEIGVLKTSCVYRGEFDPDENKVVVPAELDRVACPVTAGTLIVSRMNTPDLVGAAGFVRCGAENLFLPDRLWQVHFFKDVDAAFVHYWTRELSYRAQVQSACAGSSSSMQNLSQDEFRNFTLPLPTVAEQTAIAAFLDRETAKIDALVAEQEKLLTLLAEKRQATISHAVTKGLKPDAPMKDSGVKWLGEVPAHWEVKPMNAICSLIQTGPFGSQLHAEDYIEDGTPVINPSNLVNGRICPDWKCTVTTEMVEKLSQHVLCYGDIVIARRGEMGRCAMVQHEDVGWLCGTGSLNLRTAFGLPIFLATYLGISAVRELLKLESVGSTMENLNAGILSRVRVPFPPTTEQVEIIAFLDAETGRLDALTAEATRVIDLLKERRTALISAAVTGKIDVRHEASQPIVPPCL